jgi:hypothetical protein
VGEGLPRQGRGARHIGGLLAGSEKTP